MSVNFVCEIHLMLLIRKYFLYTQCMFTFPLQHVKNRERVKRSNTEALYLCLSKHILISHRLQFLIHLEEFMCLLFLLDSLNSTLSI